MYLETIETHTDVMGRKKVKEMGNINFLCAIVIPIYKESLDRYEELSLRQCLKILKKYKVFIVTYEHLELSNYYNIAGEYNVQLDKIFFPPSFFEGIEGYNRLMKSKDFYLSFSSFKYILIYQLDAFVFKDDLENWCRLGYDYIGAPWVEDDDGKTVNVNDWKVGNGGLSLRKVSHCLKVLKWKGPVLKYSYYKKLKYLPYMLGWKNNIAYFKNSNMNEDALFSGFLSPSYLNPNLPSPVEAASFAFEKYPSYLYRVCNNHLPFGCHAFLKYEYDSFWKQYIENV